jgi:hypothetical protein
VCVLHYVFCHTKILKLIKNKTIKISGTK